MQQTTTYKLNLIETDDVFSPEPLNQNTQKVEAALSDAAAALAAESRARQSADATETAARKKADADEATARQKAIADEAAARQRAVADEAAARKNADATETAARQKAVADEIAARKSADAAEATARQNAIAAESAALSRRITILETHKFACGTYIGSGTPQTIKLSFTPKAVVIPIATASGPEIAICVTDSTLSIIKIVTGGFTVSNVGTAHSYQYANTKGTKYTYLAFC